MLSKIVALVAGYGPKFPGVKEMFALNPSNQELQRMLSPAPEYGRYHDSTDFLSGISSDLAIGRTRFRVIIEAFISLSEELDRYDGRYQDQKIVHSLTDLDKKNLRSLCNTSGDIHRGKFMEKFTEHDTAAAGDYVKILVAQEMPHLGQMVEGICFAATSEDTMGPVFGLMCNSLVFGNLIPKLLNFMQHCLELVASIEEDKPLVMVELTHEQAAEPTTFGKKIITNLGAIERHIRRLLSREEYEFMPFSGKYGGAIGNLSTHYAAYPDIEWENFACRFIEKLGLTYDGLTFQSSLYALEADHFSIIANMFTPIIKLISDFLDLASCPGQLFYKRKRPGTKGSSIMPNKSNGWSMEGARVMLLKAQNALFFLARALPDFPHAGNMGRSYLMRALANDLAPSFIAIDRIDKEMIGDMQTSGYAPNRAEIQACLDKYPGTAGSSMQTVMKRAQIEGDPYRQIEKISIVGDGVYANAEQFRDGLVKVMDEQQLSDDTRQALLALTDPARNYGNANVWAKDKGLPNRIAQYRQLCEKFPRQLIELNV